MSTSYTVYVGPYAECEFEPEDREMQFNSCPNSECTCHKAQQALYTEFCPHCGKRSENISYTRKAAPELPDEIYDMFSQSLTENGQQDNIHIWIPNGEPSEFACHILDPYYDIGTYSYPTEALVAAIKFFEPLTPYYRRITIRQGIILEAS